MRDQYDLIAIRSDEMVNGFTLEQAELEARNRVISNDEYSIIISKRVKVIFAEPSIKVFDVESGCKYTE